MFIIYVDPKVELPCTVHSVTSGECGYLEAGKSIGIDR